MSGDFLVGIHGGQLAEVAAELRGHRPATEEDSAASFDFGIYEAERGGYLLRCEWTDTPDSGVSLTPEQAAPFLVGPAYEAARQMQRDRATFAAAGFETDAPILAAVGGRPSMRVERGDDTVASFRHGYLATRYTPKEGYRDVLRQASVPSAEAAVAAFESWEREAIVAWAAALPVSGDCDLARRRPDGALSAPTRYAYAMWGLDVSQVRVGSATRDLCPPLPGSVVVEAVEAAGHTFNDSGAYRQSKLAEAAQV